MNWPERTVFEETTRELEARQVVRYMTGTRRRRPDPGPTLSIFPDQVHIGDPVTFKKGHEVRARVQRPGDPETDREQYWPSHVRIQVRRWTAAPSRSTPEPVDGDDVEALRKELRRLRGEVVRLEDDKRELERRIAFMQQEVERLRAKLPRGPSTS